MLSNIFANAIVVKPEKNAFLNPAHSFSCNKNHSNKPLLVNSSWPTNEVLKVKSSFFIVSPINLVLPYKSIGSGLSLSKYEPFLPENTQSVLI